MCLSEHLCLQHLLISSKFSNLSNYNFFFFLSSHLTLCSCSHESHLLMVFCCSPFIDTLFCFSTKVTGRFASIDCHPPSDDWRADDSQTSTSPAAIQCLYCQRSGVASVNVNSSSVLNRKRSIILSSSLSL